MAFQFVLPESEFVSFFTSFFNHEIEFKKLKSFEVKSFRTNGGLVGNYFSFFASVKFEVFDKDQLVLLGTLDLSHSNGESEYQGWSWNMNCESNISTGTRFFQGSRNHSASPAIEVYVAGCFSGSSIVLTKALQLMRKRKQIQKVMLKCIPEYEATRSQNDDSSTFTIQTKRYPACKEQGEGNWSPYLGMESYMEGEDGEVSWFNAGVRVGLGIGFSICVGLGIGVGLLATTYQGTTKYLCRRRLL